MAALVALVSAVVPGAAHMLPSGSPNLDRAVATVPADQQRLVQAPPTDQAIPVQPPPEVLTGELAPEVAAPEPFATPSGQPGEVYALIIGIDDYPGGSSDLRWAGADATAVDAALAGFGVPAANRMVVRDGQARREPLVAAIQGLVAQAGPGTTVVLAYAGHVRKLGPETEAIIAADGGLITDTELAGLLAPAQSDHLWVLMASCYAGGFTEVLAPGRILTGAADAHSLAYESSAVKGSYLIHHMVQEGWLEGRAGPSVQEAFAYADALLAPNSHGRPVQYDEAGEALTFGSGFPVGLGSPPSSDRRPSSSPSSPPPSGGGTGGGSGGSGGGSTGAPPPPPPGQPADEPGSGCTLLVLC